MRVVCTALRSQAVGQPVSYDSWLELDAEYDVLEIHAGPDRRVLLRLMAGDAGTPALFDAAAFLVVDRKMPDCWEASVDEGGLLYIGPPEWREPGFWEAYFDREPAAVKTYHDVLDRIGSRGVTPAPDLSRLLQASGVAEFLLSEASDEELDRRVEEWRDSGLLVRRVRGRKMRTSARVFEEFAAAFQFPSYFREDWGLFDACMTDLSWLPRNRGVVVVVVDADHVLVDDPSEQLRSLVHCLVSARREWGRSVVLGKPGDRPVVPFNVVLHAEVAKLHGVSQRWSTAGVSVSWL